MSMYINALCITDIPVNSCNMILLECGHFEKSAISRKRLISFQVSFYNIQYYMLYCLYVVLSLK